jgi:hypothetical protein
MLMTRTTYASAIRDRVNNASIYASVILDDTAASTNSYNILASVLPANQLFIHGKNNQVGTLHHKYGIVDQSNPASDPMVITGSHNWSAAADTRNDENTLIVHDATVANIFFQEWVQRFKNNGGTYIVTSAGAGKAMEKTIVHALYPNPAAEAVNISYQAVAGKQVNIRIVDMMGKVINTWTYQANGDLNTQNISVRDMKSGMYLMQTIVGDAVNTQKFIVNP